MIVIPAIDLKDGRCVRLVQGDFERSTVYGDDPVAMALHWKAKGAERLHVVDLDGSRSGAPRHAGVIGAIAAATGLPVQVGGGIREMGTVEAYLGMGVGWVILGTAALRDPGFVREACRSFPGRVILGIDALAGRVAVQGWTQQGTETAVELAKRFAEDRPAALVYTDIMRDGMQTGVNIDSTRELAESAGIPVIASGGVSGITDLNRLLRIEAAGVFAVITGKALYAGSLVLEEAIALTRGRRGGEPAIEEKGPRDG
ncbi:MAG: 1-(5-phosphoribosyl)-5-[(5-phosphoribosylamino)methylideneamino]imidazole-4-carboxamide isomerase [Syntrophales bacterium]